MEDDDIEIIYFGTRTANTNASMNLHSLPKLPSSSTSSKSYLNPSTPVSLIDPSWEIIDPNPDIHSFFSHFNKTYFGSKLDFVTLDWSSVMTNYPGLTKYTPEGGVSILLSQPLLQFGSRADLVEVLLHEMIHSLLFLTNGNTHGHDEHGNEFLRHMRRINMLAGTRITIHHKFYADVKESKENTVPASTSTSSSTSNSTNANAVLPGAPPKKKPKSKDKNDEPQPSSSRPLNTSLVTFGSKNSGKPTSLVDPIWETIDPTPNVHDLFMIFNATYFWSRLGPVTVAWAPRMTTCAGICRYAHGCCSITLSTPLLSLRPRSDLVETLLHEMIHAFLFLSPGCRHERDRDGHGKDFQEHMHRINGETGANITIYHSFHNEVEYYKVHWWKCNGPCQHRAPYYGLVKRAMNRAPGPNDFWWKDHQANCGGTYIKVKEPEKKDSKGKTGEKKEKKAGGGGVGGTGDAQGHRLGGGSGNDNTLHKYFKPSSN